MGICNTHCPAEGGSDVLGTIGMAIAAIGWIIVVACYFTVYCVIPMDLMGKWIVKFTLPAVGIVALLSWRAGTIHRLFGFVGRALHIALAVAWTQLVAYGIPPLLIAAPLLLALSVRPFMRGRSKVQRWKEQRAIEGQRLKELPVATPMRELPAGSVLTVASRIKEVARRN